MRELRETGAIARLHWVAAAAMSLLVSAGCDKLQPNEPVTDARNQARERAMAQRLKAACSSPATYDRLKQVAFEEAIRIRNADPENLDILATHSLVRVEQPTVVSRDEGLDVTVCSGKFILELPPGAERAFGGERRIVADIEYAAQAAADGSGLVYQIQGAEPIIYKLAAFDLKGQSGRSVAASGPEAPPFTSAPAPDAPSRPAQAQPPLAAAPSPRVEAPPARPAPRQPSRSAEPPARAEPRDTVRANPSFNCRHARTRSERMVCADSGLASLDRKMSAIFYSALDQADARERRELRRSRDRFLAARERCATENCVAEAYRDRIDEIREITSYQ
jgi:hypothetical protein